MKEISEFLSYLRCPHCISKLEPSLSGNGLYCHSCRLDFSIQSGIPNLFISWTPTITPTPFQKYLLSPQLLKGENAFHSQDHEPLPLLDSELLFQSRYCYLFTAWRGMCWLMLLTGIFVKSPASRGIIPCAIAGFIMDWILLGIALKKQQQKEWAVLVSLLEQSKLHEKDIKASIPDADQPDVHIAPKDRKQTIADALQGVDLQGKIALHIGCGGEQDKEVLDVYAERGAQLWGIDIYQPSLQWFKTAYGACAVLADALHLPFADQSVDFVNCTDLIEHVHDPFRLLQEAHRVLKPEGHLFLITPNRCRMRRHLGLFNPCVAFQFGLGQFFPLFLPPREMLAKHRNYNFYHTSFSLSELRALVLGAGFVVDGLDVKAYRGPGKLLRKFLEKAPFFKLFNDSLFLMAQRRADPSAKVPGLV